jgi:hypothetical protein
MSHLGFATGFKPLPPVRDHDETQPMGEDAVAAATAKFNLEMPVDETGGGPDALADDGGIPLTQPEKDLPDQPDQQVGHASQIAR